MPVQLYDHQRKALNKIRNGSILRGGVGSGKSLTAIGYFVEKECEGSFNGPTIIKKPKDLYIITTARKRDTFEWDSECLKFNLNKDPTISVSGIKVNIDSWNNIKKYVDVENAFFIFDEQRVVGSGTWAKTFIKISKRNNWILLSATPGDIWMDYVPVFIANGFYKNKTHFIREHVVYNNFSKFPKIDRYINTNKLMRHRKEVTVQMKFERRTISHHEIIYTEYDKESFKTVKDNRWNIFESKPIRDIAQLFYTLRKVVNLSEDRISKAEELTKKHKRTIIFYNFNYELAVLREMCDKTGKVYAEWNGHKHEPIPDTNEWIYLVQYTAGAEGWNCITTNVIIFYSQNYSYKILAQAAGRIDRLNTPFIDLWYYHLRSKSLIDIIIARSVDKKKNFQEKEHLI